MGICIYEGAKIKAPKNCRLSARVSCRAHIGMMTKRPATLNDLPWRVFLIPIASVVQNIARYITRLDG
jgi:hypothetical protein